jgi:hypothetical protein
MATDTRTLSDTIWQPVSLALVPLQLVVPLIFVLVDFHAVGLMPAAVMGAAFTMQRFFSAGILLNLKRYFAHNDELNKATNETHQGMRVVIFTRVEDVFVSKITIPLELQLKYLFWFIYFIHRIEAVLSSTQTVVAFVTFVSYVFIMNIRQDEFPITVMPNLGYLA